MSDKRRRVYHNRLKIIQKFWKENNPQIFSVGVVDVSKTDQKDKSKHYFNGKFKQDLKYTGLNVDYIIYFLGESKTKGPEGKLKSLSDL